MSLTTVWRECRHDGMAEKIPVTFCYNYWKWQVQKFRHHDVSSANCFIIDIMVQRHKYEGWYIPSFCLIKSLWVLYSRVYRGSAPQSQVYFLASFQPSLASLKWSSQLSLAVLLVSSMPSQGKQSHAFTCNLFINYPYVLIIFLNIESVLVASPCHESGRQWTSSNPHCYDVSWQEKFFHYSILHLATTKHFKSSWYRIHLRVHKSIINLVIN